MKYRQDEHGIKKDKASGEKLRAKVKKLSKRGSYQVYR
jgi:hypothetical protein